MKRSIGFTLIELLVVIAILAMLYTMAASNVIGIQNQARVAKANGDLKTLQAAIYYYLSNNHICPQESDYQHILLRSSTTMLSNDLIDPFGESVNSLYGYKISYNKQNFVVYSVGMTKDGRATVGDDGRVLIWGNPILVTNGFL